MTQRQENTQKNGSRSERDSPVIRINSFTSKENGTTRETSDRPSVEARLKGYRVQVKKPSAPAKVKTKTKPQVKAR